MWVCMGLGKEDGGLRFVRHKGCTHIAMSLCDGAVDSHRKE